MFEEYEGRQFERILHKQFEFYFVGFEVEI